MPVSSSTEHWIKPDALTINLNHFGDPDYLQVSVLAGAVVMAFKQDVIGYNAAHNYRTWPLNAANTYLETTSAVNIYAKLTRSEVNAQALIAYDTVLRDIEGREITYAEDGSEILGEPSPDLYYVFLGQISASANSNGESVQREWTIDFRAGNLDTNQYQNEESGGEWTRMFRLNKVTDFIEVLKTISSVIFKKLSIKKGETEKVITDIKRSTDSDNKFLLDEEGNPILNTEGIAIKDNSYVPVSDETIPTTKYVEESTEKKFLCKDKEDTAKEKITFEKGVEVGSDKEGKGITYDKETKKATAIIDELKKLLLLQSDEFLQGELGSGFILKYDKEKKRSYFEIDEILVRKIAYFVSLVIKDLKHVGGSLILSPASMTCSKVEVHDTYYRCFFEQNDGEKTINNEFVAGDLARSQTFNVKEGVNNNVSNTYYWRYVVNVGDNFIDLSITDCDSGSGIPKKGDEIVQLGNRYDEGRQNAIILSTVGDDAPSIKQYKGIKYYFLSDDNAVTIFSPSGNVIKGNFISASTGKNLDEEIKDIKVDWDKILEQTDKEFTLWFFPYAPTLDNLPASEWTSEELKQLHDQDMFFDDSTGQATSGKAWRFEKKNDVWGWYEITDAETIKALENIKQKKRVFVAQPTIDDAYDVGDLWVNASYETEDYIYDNDQLVCVTKKDKGEPFDISHWRPTSNATSAAIKNLGDRIEVVVKNHNELGTKVAKIETRIGEINQSVTDVQEGLQESNELADSAKELAMTATMTGMYSGEEYNQPNNPWNDWTVGMQHKHVGALWCDTSDPETPIWKRYTGVDNSDSWEVIPNPNENYKFATFVYQNENKWTAIAAKFDKDGNPLSSSGFVTTENFAGIFSEEFGVSKAEISTFVTSDEVGNIISSAYIGADQIYLNGYTIINDNFKVDDNGNLAIDGSIVSTGKATIQLRNDTGSSTITMRANTSDSNMFIYLDTPNGSTNLDGNSFSLYDGWGHALLAGNESDVVASFANATGYEQIEIGTSFIRFLNSNADQTVYLSNTSFWMSDLNGTTHYGYTGTVGGLKFYNGLCTGEA